MHLRSVLAGSLALALAACATTPPPEPEPPVEAADVGPPAPFTVAATSNDTWNAVGQILVRTPDVSYEGRSQMMGFYAIHYRGAPLRIVTRAVLLSDTVHDTTTEVAARLPEPAPTAYADAAELMALLARELPSEIEAVKRGLKAQKAKQDAKAKAKSKPKKQKKKSAPKA